jgi:hypothetical protein
VGAQRYQQRRWRGGLRLPEPAQAADTLQLQVRQLLVRMQRCAADALLLLRCMS